MPTWRNKPANRVDLNKRYTPKQQQALHNAAKAATQRLYCDVLELWRGCPNKNCRRHLRCVGALASCRKRCVAKIPSWRRHRAYTDVVAGGPRRIPPANHKEWGMRRNPSSTILE
jgi:hypothetical protein